MQDQPGRLVERIGGAMAVGEARALEPLEPSASSSRTVVIGRRA
jgi:hypothetical protein